MISNNNDNDDGQDFLEEATSQNAFKAKSE